MYIFLEEFEVNSTDTSNVMRSIICKAANGEQTTRHAKCHRCLSCSALGVRWAVRSIRRKLGLLI